MYSKFKQDFLGYDFILKIEILDYNIAIKNLAKCAYIPEDHM